MPFNGNTFTRLQSWVANAALGIKIRADLMDQDTNDIAAGLTAVATAVAAVFTTLAAQTGSSLIGFVQAGVGAINRTMQDKGREVFTDADFSSLALAVAAAAGKTLRITQSATVAAALTIPSNTTIVFDAGVTITTATPDIHVFDASGASNVHLQGFGKISSTATTGTLSRKGLVNFTGSTDCDVSGLELIGMQWAGVLMATGSVNCWVYNCRIHDFLATVQDCAGVQIIDGAINCGVHGGYIKNPGYHGVNVQETGGGLVPVNTVVEGVKISGCKVYGVNCYNKTASNINQFSKIRGNTISDVMGGAPYNTSGGAGVYVQSAGGTEVTGNTISNCCWGTSDNSLTPAGVGVSLNGATSAPVIVEDNVFTDMGFSTTNVANPNAVTIAAVSFNSGVVGGTVGPNTVYQLRPNTGFGFVGYYINANSNVTILPGVMYISTTAINSVGITALANTLNVSGLVIHPGVIVGCDFAHVRIDQVGGFHVSNSQIIDGSLSGGSANCVPLVIAQAQSLGITGVMASATTATALSLSSSTNCVFSGGCRFASTGTSEITTAGTCTGSLIKDFNYTADSRISNVGTGCTIHTRGSAAPTVGTWAVGDTREQSVPVVGNPKRWRCTSAGVPGTHTSEGNL